MIKSRILSSGSELGSNIVSTRDILLEAKFDDCTLVETSLGINEVRQAPDNFAPSMLAIPAAEKAILKSGISPGQFDAVVYCGIERDCPEPATAHIIASALGLSPKICFDIANACHGFTSGLQIINSFIKTGEIQYALVVTAELSSKVTKEVAEMFRSGKLTPQDIRSHIGAFSVGDAGGAMVIGPSDTEQGIDRIKCASASKYHSLCTYKINDGKLSFNMDMGRISAVTLKLVKDLIGPTYEELHWSPDEVDLLIPHQVGVKPYEKALEIMQIDKDRSIATYPSFGNLASATIPVCYDMLDQQGRLKKGSKMLMATTGSGIVASFTGISI